MPIKIATWNVNSIKSRLGIVTGWLKTNSPDIVLLQELKCETAAFPYMEIEDLGYNVAVNGQKTYNGVAVLSKFPIEEVIKDLPGDEADSHARYIEAVVSVSGNIVRAASVYVPNGQSVGSDKFAYKLKFLERLCENTRKLLEYDEIFVLGGDYNVAPEAIDVFDAARLDGSICFHPEERARLNALMHLGLTDTFRSSYPEARQYSWWDYRAGSFQQNLGMRIDMLLASPRAADLVIAAGIDEHPRALEKASDHAPVWVEIQEAGNPSLEN